MATETAPSPSSTLHALSEFSAAPEVGGSDPSKSFPWQYWRTANGTIVVGPAWDSEYVRQAEKGFRTLAPQFGRFHWKTSDAPKDPYHRILHMPGGPEAFTTDQIIEHGWCCRAPYGIVFSQMSGVAHHTVHCTGCGKRFQTEDDRVRHEQIAHQASAANAQLGRAIADAQKDGMGEPLANALTLIAETQAAQQQQNAALNAQLAAQAEANVQVQATLLLLLERLVPGAGPIPVVATDVVATAAPDKPSARTTDKPAS